MVIDYAHTCFDVVHTMLLTMGACTACMVYPLNG